MIPRRLLGHRRYFPLPHQVRIERVQAVEQPTLVGFNAAGQIGGFVKMLMWDGIDCHRCRMLGWSARSFDDPALRFLHLRTMGSSQGGLWRGRWRHGTGQWFMGTGLVYMTASALRRSLEPPFFTGGLAMWLSMRSMDQPLVQYLLLGLTLFVMAWAGRKIFAGAWVPTRAARDAEIATQVATAQRHGKRGNQFQFIRHLDLRGKKSRLGAGMAKPCGCLQTIHAAMMRAQMAINQRSTSCRRPLASQH